MKIGVLLILLGISAPALAQTRDAPPPPSFAQCAGCHSTQSGKTLFGPSLFGIAGRKAGSLEGYVYSEALKSSRFVWDAATLDRWLTDPRKALPGNRMPFGGVTDPASRKELVTYLLSLR